MKTESEEREAEYADRFVYDGTTQWQSCNYCIYQDRPIRAFPCSKCSHIYHEEMYGENEDD